nr:SCO family protein [Cohaesibacter intestini]
MRARQTGGREFRAALWRSEGEHSWCINLTDHTGRAATEADFNDKPMVIFFGYTFCPDVCPTTLAEMVGWVEDLGEEADALHYVFVSVDAERDDQETLASYVGAFFDQLVGLYGTQQQVLDVTKAYKVYAKKNEPNSEEGYFTIDHTATVYLMAKGNRLSATIGFGESHDSAVAKLRRLISSVE